MKCIVVFFLFFYTNLILGQFDNKDGGKKFSIPIIPSKNAIVKPTNATSKFSFESKPSYSDKFPNPNLTLKKRDYVTENKNDFINTGIIIKDKLNAEKGNFLGDFKTKSNYVRIVCRDFGEFDGDKVSVYLNDVLVNESILLELSHKEIVINLVSGFNKIQFQALNEGYSSPNTAEFEMYDDKGSVITSNQWQLLIGDRATIYVTK